MAAHASVVPANLNLLYVFYFSSAFLPFSFSALISILILFIMCMSCVLHVPCLLYVSVLLFIVSVLFIYVG